MVPDTDPGEERGGRAAANGGGGGGNAARMVTVRRLRVSTVRTDSSPSVDEVAQAADPATVAAVLAHKVVSEARRRYSTPRCFCRQKLPESTHVLRYHPSYWLAAKRLNQVSGQLLAWVVQSCTTLLLLVPDPGRRHQDFSRFEIHAPSLGLSSPPHPDQTSGFAEARALLRDWLANFIFGLYQNLAAEGGREGAASPGGAGGAGTEGQRAEALTASPLVIGVARQVFGLLQSPVLHPTRGIADER